MNSMLLKLGDRVVITIDPETRAWGYNPCPDGTVGVVRGFDEIVYGRTDNLGLTPGFYVNRSWVKLGLEGGRKHVEWSGRLTLADQDEYNRRLDEWQKTNNPRDWKSRSEFKRPLPKTRFWEGDRVRLHEHTGITVITRGEPDANLEDLVVTKIDYAQLRARTNSGAKRPAYQVSERFGAGWQTFASAGQMSLVSRGNVWKLYHNETLTFGDLKEEAEFYHRVGHTEEVRNPRTDLYAWTKDEVLEAIRNGTAHGFFMSVGFLGTGPSIEAVRFRDEELGRRVAEATLNGFSLNQ